MTDNSQSHSSKTTEVDHPTASHREVFATAVQFLTRVPVSGAMGGSAEYYFAALRRSVVYFPLVGGLVGLSTAAVFWLALSIGCSPAVAALIALAAEATLTGAFHEDAFADTWDALGGGWTREQVLTIMKDSRLGTYGTIALVIGVGLRAMTTGDSAAVGWAASMALIVAAATMGRLAILVMMATTDPVDSPDSQSKDVSGTQTGRVVWTGGLFSLPLWLPWCLIDPLRAGGSIVAAAVTTYWFRRKVLRRVGGTTGDLLGCTAFLVQLIVLIGGTIGLMSTTS